MITPISVIAFFMLPFVVCFVMTRFIRREDDYFYAREQKIRYLRRCLDEDRIAGRSINVMMLVIASKLEFERDWL